MMTKYLLDVQVELILIHLLNYTLEPVPADNIGLRIELKGLKGGHSGMDIHLGRGNANILLNRFLYEASEQFNLRIEEFDGGSLRNAIPREAVVNFTIPNAESKDFKTFFDDFVRTIKDEFSEIEPNLDFDFLRVELPKQVMAVADQIKAYSVFIYNTKWCLENE